MFLFFAHFLVYFVVFMFHLFNELIRDIDKGQILSFKNKRIIFSVFVKTNKHVNNRVDCSVFIGQKRKQTGSSGASTGRPLQMCRLSHALFWRSDRPSAPEREDIFKSQFNNLRSWLVDPADLQDQMCAAAVVNLVLFSIWIKVDLTGTV